MLDRNHREMNIKDSSSFSSMNTNSGATLKDTKSFSTSYTKTNKLIAALYMVTDIIDPSEPLRAKLRTLGADIISDINSSQPASKVALSLSAQIVEVMSFLDIASLIGMISEMNHNILHKEFAELMVAVKESGQTDYYGGHSSLSEFLQDDPQREELFTITAPLKDSRSYIGQNTSTRIGVQKGHNLMKALSDRMPGLSVNKNVLNNGSNSIKDTYHNREKIDALKTERRAEIVSIVKANGTPATITDIKSRARGPLASQSEKTLQRELFAMVTEGVLNKTGEKRWSRYSLK